MANKNCVLRLVDDDPTFLRVQRTFFELSDYAVRAYSSGLEFLEKDDFRTPGCLVLDVRMPEMTGLELQDLLNRRGCDIPVIFLSGHGDIEMAVECVQKGAFTFLPKPSRPEKLLEAVEKAVKLHLEKRKVKAENAALIKLFDSLSEGEKETARLLAKGLSNAEAAEVSGLSPRTVQARRAEIYAKLEVQNAVEILQFLQFIGEAQ